jgi:MFS family permease
VQYICCILGSVLTDLFGARRIGLIGASISTISMALSIFIRDIKLYFLTYSLLFGIGQALLLGATLSILPHYFHKKLSLANGCMNLLSSVIVVILPVCTYEIIANFGLKGTFIFLTALNLVTVFTSFTYISVLPNHQHENAFKRLRKSLALKVLIKKEFIIWSICSLIGQFGYLIPIVVIVSKPKNQLLLFIVSYLFNLQGSSFGQTVSRIQSGVFECSFCNCVWLWSCFFRKTW